MSTDLLASSYNSATGFGAIKTSEVCLANLRSCSELTEEQFISSPYFKLLANTA